MIHVYFDGSCIPKNPGGIAGFGYEVHKSDGEDSFFRLTFGYGTVEAPKGYETTNNLAEYAGLLGAVDFLLSRHLEKEQITVYGDSQLVINQMFSTWKIKKGAYKDLALKTKKLLKQFTNITGQWIPREENERADELSKMASELK